MSTSDSASPGQGHNALPDQAWETRVNLAACYRIFAHRGMDDSIYTHLSARLPGTDRYLFIPFGMLFDEVTASNLMEVDIAGKLYPAIASLKPLYDPTNEMVKA